LGHLACTCKRLQELCSDPSIWKKLYKRCYKIDRPIVKTSTNNLYELVTLISGPGRPDIPWKKYFSVLSKAHHVVQDETLIYKLEHIGKNVIVLYKMPSIYHLVLFLYTLGNTKKV